MRLFGSGRGSGWIDGDHIPLEIPRASISPCTVYTRNRKTHSFQELGSLADILANEYNRPISDVLWETKGLPNLDHVSDQSTKIALALRGLTDFFQACNLAVDLEGRRTRETEVKYELIDATKTETNLIMLDEWIAQSSLSGEKPMTADLAVNGRLYVAVSTVQARTVRISVINGGEAQVKIKTEAKPLATSIGASVAYEGTHRSTAIVTTTEPICVGVKLARILCELPNGFRLNIDGTAKRGESIRGPRTRCFDFLHEDALAIDDVAEV